MYASVESHKKAATDPVRAIMGKKASIRENTLPAFS